MLVASLTPCLHVWVENVLPEEDSELEKDVPLDRVRVRKSEANLMGAGG